MNILPARLDDRAAQLRRAFDLSFAVQARPETALTEDFLAIRVASESYAIRCSEILGLIADKKITRVPSRAAALHGMGGFRGAILPVYSLAALLGHPKAAIARWTVIAADLPVALAFEALDGNLRISRAKIMPCEAGERSCKYVRDFMREQGQVRAILHLPSVLDAIKALRSGPGAIEEV